MCVCGGGLLWTHRCSTTLCRGRNTHCTGGVLAPTDPPYTDGYRRCSSRRAPDDWAPRQAAACHLERRWTTKSGTRGDVVLGGRERGLDAEGGKPSRRLARRQAATRRCCLSAPHSSSSRVPVGGVQKWLDHAPFKLRGAMRRRQRSLALPR